MITINDLTFSNADIDRTLSNADMAKVSGGIQATTPEKKYYVGDNDLSKANAPMYADTGYDLVAWNSLDKEGLANGDRKG